MRVREAINPICFTCDLRVSACRLSIRRKAFLGSCPSCSYRQGDAKSLWLSGEHHLSTRGRKVDELMLVSASGGHGFRLGRA